MNTTHFADGNVAPLVIVAGLTTVLTLTALLTRSVLQRHRQASNTVPATADIPLADMASDDDTVRAHSLLSTLPQFRQLSDGRLIDWLSGAFVSASACESSPDQRLEVTWARGHGVRFVTRTALVHYLAFHTAFATLLTTMSPPVHLSDVSPTAPEEH